MVKVRILLFSLGSISYNWVFWGGKKATNQPTKLQRFAPRYCTELFLTLLPVSAQRNTVISAFAFPNSVFIRHRTLMQPTNGLYLHKLCMLLVDLGTQGCCVCYKLELLELSSPFCFKCWVALWYDQEVQ